MNRFIMLLLAVCMLFPACGGKKDTTPDNPSQGQTTPGGGDEGPTAAQIATVSDFVALAIAGDDYCEGLTNEGGRFTVTTFSGKSCAIDAEIPILQEGEATAGKKNYVIDGARFAEFHLSGETLSLPSDIHQWYNPPLPRNCESFSVLFCGNAFCDDATILLPGMLAATNSATLKAGRALKSGAALADWNTNYSTASWCALSVWDANQSDWPIVIGNNSSLESAVKSQPWDVITIMEDSCIPAGWSFDAGEEGVLNSLLDKIFRSCTTKRPTVLLMLAPALPSAHETVAQNFEGDGMKMFEALTAWGKAVTDRTCIYDVVSICAAQQNLRTSSLIYSSANELTRDGVRLDCGVGCFTAAGTVFCKIVETCTGFKFAENTYVYELESSTEGEIATPVTSISLPLCRYAASNAALYPFKLTDLSSLSPDINGSEIPDAGRDPYPDIL